MNTVFCVTFSSVNSMNFFDFAELAVCINIFKVLSEAKL